MKPSGKIIKMVEKDRVSNFPSRNFTRSEFSCNCGCSFNTVDAELLYILNAARSFFKSPIRINSGCRCEQHNAKNNGAKNSYHLKGKAADIVVIGVSPGKVYSYFTSKYPNKYGFGNYKSFTHVDVRPAMWRG